MIPNGRWCYSLDLLPCFTWSVKACQGAAAKEEAQAAPDGQLGSELADVLEVLRALAAAYGMSWEDVVAEAARKRDERGGFDQRIFLEYVEQVS
jgi:hypothetical protein